MTRIAGRSWTLVPVAAAVALVGCTVGEAPAPRRPRPQITAISTTEAGVGDTVRFAGTDFVAPEEGWVDVTFRGQFIPADGSAAEPVDLNVALARDTDGTVVWPRFGLYRVPFAADGAKLGRFEGEVFATNRYFDGTSDEQAPDARLPVTLGVRPSLVVLDFRAQGESWVADCRYPTTTALNGMTYAFRVRALGFMPDELQFTVGTGLMLRNDEGNFVARTEPTRLPPVTGVTEHALFLQFAPVPANTDGYRTSITVRAPSGGRVYEITYPIMVRQPLQVYFTRPMEIAEIFQPEIVSGCIPGGAAGVHTTYSEMTAETRSRTIQHTVDRGWEMSYSQENSETWGRSVSMGGSTSQTRSVSVTDARTTGYSRGTTDSFSTGTSRTNATRLDFSRTDGSSYGYSVNRERSQEFNRSVGGSVETGVRGEVGIPMVANGSAHVNVSVDGRMGWVDGTRTGVGGNAGVNSSSTSGSGTSNSTTVDQQRTRARSEGWHWDLTQTYSESNSFTTERNWQNSRSYSESRAHSRALSERLGTSDSEALTVSTTESTSLHTSGMVFAGQFGVWYRQASRLVRYGTVVAYDLCGNGSEVGTIKIDDWTWAPNLAIGPSCPPPTNLPPAQCRIGPCSGQ